jgi:S-adenosylmethionine-diacylgycerolhomoserine-N-methlytransferase
MTEGGWPEPGDGNPRKELFRGRAQLLERLSAVSGTRAVEIGDRQPGSIHESVHCAYFSYALTTSTDWHHTIGEAIALVSPGGILGVVDFYVSCPRRRPGVAHHRWLERKFWKRWFRRHGMTLSCEHLPCLQARLETLHLGEHSAPLPGLPWLAAPYYIFIGRKPAEAGAFRTGNFTLKPEG